MYLYIDTYFIFNLLVDYLILLSTAKLRGLKASRLRLGAAALSGAAYAVFTVITSPRFLENPLIILAELVVMLLIAFGGMDGLLKTALVFAAVSAAFGGFALAIGRLLGRLRIDLGILILSFVLCWVILKLVFSRVAAARPENVEVFIGHCGRSISIKAMGDSGNLLHDPVTGDAVLIAEARAVSNLFDGETAALLRSRAEVTELIMKLQSKTKFRLIPFNTVGGSGFLMAFKPELIKVNGVTRRDLLVAVTKERVSDTGAFSAIIGGAV